MYLKQPAWGNAAGSRGRRITDEDLVEKARRKDETKADLARSIGYSFAGSAPGHVAINRATTYRGLGHGALMGIGGAAAGVGVAEAQNAYHRKNRRKKASVDKAYYDPEARRQRAFGMGEAGLGLTGAGAIAAGGHQARKDTKNLISARGVTAERGVETLTRGGDSNTLKGVVRLRKKPAALMGAGAAALYGAHRINRHAESERGKKWD